MLCLSSVFNTSSFWRKMNLFYLKYASSVPEKKAKARKKKSKCIVPKKKYIIALSLTHMCTFTHIF